MKILVGCILLFALAAWAFAANEESLENILANAKTAEARCDVSGALRSYRRADELRPNDANILHEISKQLSDSIDDAPESQRLNLAREALAYSERSAQLAPKNPVYVLSLAICYGRIANLGDNRTRVEASHKVQQYAEAALALDPDYAWAHHVLGEWNLGVARVNGALRALARFLYGGLPTASVASGMAELQRAVELEPGSASHQLALGLAYLETGDKSSALVFLQRGLALPTREVQDQKLKAQATEALKTLSAK